MSSEARQIAVALTHSGSGILSVCGSSLIFSSLLVQSRRNQKKFRPFQRLLLGLTIYDLLHTLAVSFSTLPVRADADVWGAHGTIATCTAQGFFQQQAQAGFIYNSAMALYFLAVVRYGLKDNQIVRYEKYFHITTFVAFEALAITGLFKEWYNPMWFPELGCWYGPWPTDCVGDTCERGEYSFWLAVFGAIIFQVLAFIIIFVSNLLIYMSFREQELQMAKYQGAGDRRFSREIAIQGFLYSAAALNTVLWGFLSLFLGTFDELSDGAELFIALMNAFMFPIQGFLTFLIYLRPIYNRARKNNLECGRWQVARIALFEDERTARLKLHASRSRLSTTAGISNVTRVSSLPLEHSPECNVGDDGVCSGGDDGGCNGSVEEDTESREDGEKEAATTHDETNHVRFASEC